MPSRNCLACHKDYGVSHSRSNYKSYLSSKNVLDIRIVPGHPDNAWIECYNNSYDIDAQPGMAKHHAEVQSEKVLQKQLEKEDKLKQFQQEVAKRVNYIQKLKRREEKLRSIKLIEDEQTVLYQRTIGLNVKGTSQSFKSLNCDLMQSCIPPPSITGQLSWEDIEQSNLLLEETARMLKSQSCKAKTALLSKKVDGDHNSLPGGVWTKSPTKTRGNQSNVDSASDNPQLHSLVNGSPPDTWSGMRMIKPTTTACEGLLKNSSCIVQTKAVSTARKVCNENDEEEAVVLGPFQMNLVNDNLNRGHIAEQEKSKQNQYWKFRQIFMDIERDQVREKRRRQNQRQKVEKLKLHKELERRFEEDRLRDFQEEAITEDDDETPDHSGRYAEPPKSSPLQKRAGYEIEVYRYIEALLQTAKERVKLCNIVVPPICSCAPTIWDSHPEKCANNCIFHRNPKEYIQALTAALRNSR